MARKHEECSALLVIRENLYHSDTIFHISDRTVKRLINRMSKIQKHGQSHTPLVGKIKLVILDTLKAFYRNIHTYWQRYIYVCNGEKLETM